MSKIIQRIQRIEGYHWKILENDSAKKMWKQKDNDKLTGGSLVVDAPVFSFLESGKEFSDFPYSVVITQKCDIESYHRVIESGDQENQEYNRQLILQVLLLPAFDEESFQKGTHLEKQYKKKTKAIDDSQYKRIKGNQDFRFHYLKSNIDTIPTLVIDFKHYFTTPIEIVVECHKKQRGDRFELEFVHYTDLSDRFAHYIQRVAV